MRVKLSQIDSEAFELNLSPPDASSDAAQWVRVLSAAGIGGQLSQSEGELELSDVCARRAVLDALRLVFGSVVLQVGGKSELDRIVFRYLGASGNVDLELGIGHLASPRLSVSVGNVHIVANTNLSNAKLSVQGAAGQIFAAEANFGGLLVEIGTTRLAFPEIAARDLLVSWGRGSFELRAADVAADTAELKSLGTVLKAEELRSTELLVRDADWSLRGLTATRGSLDLDMVKAPTEVDAPAVAAPAELATSSEPPSPSEEAPQAYVPERPVFDWRLLDGVTGQVGVDVDVEVEVPVIQSRRAVHEVRVELDRGTVDFHRLEHSLSTLEDALLDFSVREQQLVLELGLPLLPTRGHGKKLLCWPLTEEELALAAERRVRLATLAHPRPPEPTSEPVVRDDATNRQDRLRGLAFRKIDLELSVESPARPFDALLKAVGIGHLALQGEIFARGSEGQTNSRLQARMSEVMVDLDDFPLAGRRFDLKRVCATQVPSLELELEALAPKRLRLGLSGVSANSVDFGVFAE